MDHKGDIEEHGPLEVFEYVASRRADGVVYFRDADGLSSYVTVKDGVPYHSGGNFGDGDTGVLGTVAIEKGSYKYIEDITTDDAIFPGNISPELANVLISGKAANALELVEMFEESARRPTRVKERITSGKTCVGPMVLPAGRAVGTSEYIAEDAVDVFLKLRILQLSGLLTIERDGARLGLFVVKDGERSAGCVEIEGTTLHGDEAVNNVPAGCEYRFYELPENLLGLYDAAAAGSRMVVRMDSAAVNPEEFIAWAAETGKSCIIATDGSAGSANILIVNGEVVGAVTPRSPEINPVIDDALAIFYAVDSEAEIFG
jgi:hypothetical protein